MRTPYSVVLLLACCGLPLVAGCGDGDLPATAISAQAAQPAAPAVALPNRAGSLKFAVLGDFGTGDRAQLELAQQMAAWHDRFKYDLVVLVGDNLTAPSVLRTSSRNSKIRTSRCSTRR